MDKIDKNKILYFLMIIVVLGLFWGWYYIEKSQGTELTVSGSEGVNDGIKNSSAEKIIVYITGAIKNPGVIELTSDARMIEAVDAAGGLLNIADVEAINLARKLKDEEKIHIPAIGEISVLSESSDLININTADLDELKSLPGVGDVIAQGIIDYREKNGAFTQLEELKNVTRIGDKVFEGLAQLIII